MKFEQIRQILNAQVLCCDELLEGEASTEAYASDMMSDVLAFVTDQTVLLTGLINEQVIRTAAMLDMHCIVLVRGKQPTPGMVQLAKQNGIALMATGFNLFESCGRLYSSGMREGG